MEPTLYHNPRCQKSRQAKKLLDDAGVKYKTIEYLNTLPDINELRTLAAKLGLKPIEMVRKKEIAYLAFGLDKPGVSDDKVLKAIVDQPILLERPIFVKGDKAVIGRPPERIQELM